MDNEIEKVEQKSSEFDPTFFEFLHAIDEVKDHLISLQDLMDDPNISDEDKRRIAPSIQALGEYALSIADPNEDIEEISLPLGEMFPDDKEYEKFIIWQRLVNLDIDDKKVLASYLQEVRNMYDQDLLKKALVRDIGRLSNRNIDIKDPVLKAFVSRIVRELFFAENFEKAALSLDFITHELKRKINR